MSLGREEEDGRLRVPGDQEVPCLPRRSLASHDGSLFKAWLGKGLPLSIIFYQTVRQGANPKSYHPTWVERAERGPLMSSPDGEPGQLMEGEPSHKDEVPGVGGLPHHHPPRCCSPHQLLLVQRAKSAPAPRLCLCCSPALRTLFSDLRRLPFAHCSEFSSNTTSWERPSCAPFLLLFSLPTSLSHSPSFHFLYHTEHI